MNFDRFSRARYHLTNWPVIAVLGIVRAARLISQLANSRPELPPDSPHPPQIA